jgi:protease II
VLLLGWQQLQFEWQLLLPPQLGLLLEAAFVCQQCEGAADLGTTSDNSSDTLCSSSSSRVWQLVVLSVEHRQEQQQWHSGSKLSRQVLHAHMYTFQLPHPSQTRQQQQQQQQQLARQVTGQHPAVLQLVCSCDLPLPDAFYQLTSASWHPGCGELRVAFSSLVRPVSKLTVNLQQLAAQQQQQQQQPQQHPQQQQQEVTTRQVGPHDSMQDQQWQQQQQQQPSPEKTAASSSSAHTAYSLQPVQPLPPGFDQSSYDTLQLQVPAADGALVPVSLAWNRHKSHLPKQLLDAAALAAANSGCTGEAVVQNCTYSADSNTGSSTDAASQPPLLLSCYGSYGIREAVAFDPELLQLLNDGWLLAVAHVRGGGWLGRAWAEAGRGVGKATSVSDLLAVAGYITQVRLVLDVSESAQDA